MSNARKIIVSISLSFVVAAVSWYATLLLVSVVSFNDHEGRDYFDAVAFRFDFASLASSIVLPLIFLFGTKLTRVHRMGLLFATPILIILLWPIVALVIELVHQRSMNNFWIYLYQLPYSAFQPAPWSVAVYTAVWFSAGMACLWAYPKLLDSKPNEPRSNALKP